MVVGRSGGAWNPVITVRSVLVLHLLEILSNPLYDAWHLRSSMDFGKREGFLFFRSVRLSRTSSLQRFVRETSGIGGGVLAGYFFP